MTALGNETTLPTSLSRYPLEIFNADEFGFFYKCLTEKTYYFKKENCSGRWDSSYRNGAWQCKRWKAIKWTFRLLASRKIPVASMIQGVIWSFKAKSAQASRQKAPSAVGWRKRTFEVFHFDHYDNAKSLEHHPW